MIKVITIDGYGWEKHRINPDKDPNLYWKKKNEEME